MKTRRLFLAILVLSYACLNINSAFLQAATTIDATNKYAYGANIGWMDWSGGSSETTTGAVIGDSPVVADGTVYVGSSDGNVYALNAATGSLG